MNGAKCENGRWNGAGHAQARSSMMTPSNVACAELGCPRGAASHPIPAPCLSKVASRGALCAGLRRHYAPLARLRRAARALNSALRPGNSQGGPGAGPGPLSLYCQEGNRAGWGGPSCAGIGRPLARAGMPRPPLGLCSSGPSGCMARRPR